MKFERINGKLVLVSSARGTRMLGGAMALFGIYLFAAFMSLAGSTLWIKIFVIVWGLGFVGGSLLALFVPDITTEFDLAARNAAIQRSRRLGTTTRATVIPLG